MKMQRDPTRSKAKGHLFSGGKPGRLPGGGGRWDTTRVYTGYTAPSVSAGVRSYEQQPGDVWVAG